MNVDENIKHFVGSLIISTLLFSNAIFSIETMQTTEKLPIKIGMSTVLSGPAKELGQQVKLGVETYFASVNDAGGIAGRKLELIVLDDRYEPGMAGKNMRELADNNQVLAVIGNVGTPTAMVTVPIANEKKILLIGAFTGAQILRKTPPDRYVINLRASYQAETASMIQGLLSIGIKPNEIAFFLQNDSYGDAGYQGAMKALKEAGYSNTEKLMVARYARNTLNVEDGIANFLIEEKPPKAIIMVGAYAPTAKFIRLVKKIFPKILFLNVSFVGSAALVKMLGQESENVIITQVVPSLDSDLPAIKAYRQDLKKYGGEVPPDYGSLEGYLDAKLLVMGLREAAANNVLTREGIIDSFEKMHMFDIGINEKIDLSKDDHETLRTIWPTIIQNGKFEPLIWSTIKVLK